MKKIVMAGMGALAAMLQPAAAADMPVKAPPPVVTVFDWNGWYLGANGGYSWGKWNSTCPTDCFVGQSGAFAAPNLPGNPAALAGFLGSFTNSASPNVNGWVAGIHGGRNWQMNQNWLVGLEADFDWTREKDDQSGTVSLRTFGNNDDILNRSLTVENQWRFKWFGTLRGRVGWVNDTWLLYGTGGLAVGKVSYAVTNTLVTSRTNLAGAPLPGTAAFPVGTFVTGGSDSEVRWGLAVGAGIEKAFTRNWIGRAEYLYIDLGNHTFFSGTAFETNVKVRDHVFRVGLSYLFKDAVTARY